MYYQISFVTRIDNQRQEIADATYYRLRDQALVVKRDNLRWIHPMDTIRDISIVKTVEQAKP